MTAFLIGLICGLIMVIIVLGANFRPKKVRHSPPVTVVVCARDEENSIFNCLMSISTQDYPDEKVSAVLVNHLSNDNTGAIMDNFAESSPFPVKVIHIEEPDPELPGKTQALNAAMELVSTEYILMTDADCTVPEKWIRTLVSYFDKGVLAVGGMVSVGPSIVSPGNWVPRIQNVDHRYFMAYVSGLSGWSAKLFSRDIARKGSKRLKPNRFFLPAFVSGNNMAIRKSVYDAVGGYSSLESTLIEDYALLHKMIRTKPGYLAFALEPDARVSAEPLCNLKELWLQKRRWATSTNTPDLFSYLLYAVIFSSRVILPWFVIFQPSGTVFGLVMVAIASNIVIKRVSALTGHRIRMRDILYHEVFQIVLNTALVLASFFRTQVVWKGVKYSPRGK